MYKLFHREARPISQPERAVVSACRHRSTLIIYPRISCNTGQSFSRRSIFRVPIPVPVSFSPVLSRLLRCREWRETLWNRSGPCFKEESSRRILRNFIVFFCAKRNSDSTFSGTCSSVPGRRSVRSLRQRTTCLAYSFHACIAWFCRALRESHESPR